MRLILSAERLDDEDESYWEEQDRLQAEHDAMVEALRPLVWQVFGFARRGNKYFVGEFDIEEFWSEDRDDPNLRALYVSCPDCRRRIAPFQSRSVVAFDGGMRWVGLSHQEPYTDYFAACGWCGSGMLFTIYVPQ